MTMPAILSEWPSGIADTLSLTKKTEMSLPDLGSKPIEKLIDVISKGIGIIYKPRQIRNEAKANAEAKLLEAQTEAKAEVIKAHAESETISIIGDAKLDLLERAKSRLLNEELIKQQNIEEIAEKSILYLDTTKYSEEPVDKDWRNRFFQKASNVSNEEVQEIWAKILSKEVEKPGVISLRTLEILSNLSKREAEIFFKFCTLVSKPNRVYKFKGENDLSQYDIDYDSVMTLKEAGLIDPSDSLAVQFKNKKGTERIGPNIFEFSREDTTPLKLDAIILTKAGTELYAVIEPNFNFDYQKELLEDISKSGITITKIQ